MGIRAYKPTSAGTRHRTVSDFTELTAKKPWRALTVALRKSGGRNNIGRMTMRTIGGGNKRRYRIVDFRRTKDNVAAKVETIEYDPNRSPWIARLLYADGERRYILAPQGLSVGESVMSGAKVEPRTGNCMELGNIPTGLAVHNIELVPGGGGKLVRAAGASAQVMAREQTYVYVMLPSGEVRKIHARCRATIGTLGNTDHAQITYGKAGVSRWLGVRPISRGSAQNPVSHPMGGGEGRRAGGRHPVSKWGKLAKGGKTRKPRKTSNAFIVTRRRRGRFQKT